MLAAYVPLRKKKRIPRGSVSPEERFWANLDKKTALPCWLYRADVTEGNNPRMKIEGKMVLVRRFAFELQRGPIPEGHDVSQSCGNPSCMFGGHLVTHARNGYARPERPTTPPSKGRHASMHWKDIPGFLGYEASDQGEVRSWWVHGRSAYAHRPKVLKPTRNKVNGYLYVMLTNEHGKTNALVHLCVLNAFVGHCPPGKEGRHFPDNDRSNNKLTNLSWSTHQENMDDKHAHGTVARGPGLGAAIRRSAKRGAEHYTKAKPELVVRGSGHWNAKLTPELYDYVLELLAACCTQKDVAAEVGIDQSTVSDIKTGKRKR